MLFHIFTTLTAGNVSLDLSGRGDRCHHKLAMAYDPGRLTSYTDSIVGAESQCNDFWWSYLALSQTVKFYGGTCARADYNQAKNAMPMSGERTHYIFT